MRSILLKCIVLILALSPIAAQAQGVTADAVYWQRDDGLYVVDVTFHNHRVSAEYYMAQVAACNASQAGAPEGWDAIISFRDVDWRTYDAQYVLKPSKSLSGFMFTQQAMAPDYNWAVYGFEDGDYGTFTPIFVPEPTSLLTLAAGTAGLLIRKRRHNP